MAKTLETIKILRAFVLMSKNKSEGVNYKEFVKENYDTSNVFKREYLLEYSWARNTSGDDVFGECWVPPWNEECFFDLESAVHCQNKMSADVLKTAHDMGLLDDDKRDTDIPDALNDNDVCSYV